MKVRTRKALSIALVAMLAVQLLGATALQAFADTVSAASQRLVYAEVYGVQVGDYALMVKKAGVAKDVYGKDQAIIQQDVVNAQGEVTISTRYAEGSWENGEMAGDGWSAYQIDGDSFAQWEGLVRTRDTNAYKEGVMRLDGSTLLSPQYGALAYSVASGYAAGCMVAADAADAKATLDIVNAKTGSIQSVSLGTAATVGMGVSFLEEGSVLKVRIALVDSSSASGYIMTDKWFKLQDGQFVPTDAPSAMFLDGRSEFAEGAEVTLEALAEEEATAQAAAEEAVVQEYESFASTAQQVGTLPDGTALYRQTGESSNGKYAVVDADGNPVKLQGYTLGTFDSYVKLTENYRNYYVQWASFAVDNKVQRGDRDFYYVANSFGKWGAINSAGDVLVPFEYDGYYDMGRTDTNYTLLKKGDAWEFYDTSLSNAPRLAGESTAVETSAKIAREACPDGSDWVVVARWDLFMDAMSSTGLAGALDAPIVLTDRDGLSEAAAKVVRDLGATKAYVIGGTGALSAKVDEGLEAAGVSFVERVYGEWAWETSVECAKRIEEHGGNASGDAIVAMSTNFQDALSISSFAYAYGVPIFLETDAARGRVLTDDALARVKALEGTVYVPGGTGAVPEASVEGVLGGERVQRLYGDTGFDTSNQIARWMVENGKLSADVVSVACGAMAPGGADALSGAALAGAKGGVILLATSNEAMEPANVCTVEGSDSKGDPAFLSSRASEVRISYVLGGTYVIPDDLREKIAGLIG